MAPADDRPKQPRTFHPCPGCDKDTPDAYAACSDCWGLIEERHRKRLSRAFYRAQTNPKGAEAARKEIVRRVRTLNGVPKEPR